jgi:hypothetical protein
MVDIDIPYPRPKRILAVDPGGRAGVAVFNLTSDEKFMLDGAWEISNRVKPVSETVARFAQAERTPGVVVLERQYFQQVNGLEQLLRYRHEWEVLAEVFKVPVSLVYPSSWQSKMLPFKGRQKKNAAGEKIGPDTKEQALMACEKLWPHLIDLWEPHEDARDAALLGRFYANLLEV